VFSLTCWVFDQQEDEVITMSLYAKIRRMYFREKTPISEIARKTSLSRNTIKKWLKVPVCAELKYPPRTAPSKLDPYAAELRQAIDTDARRPKRDRRTLKVLFRELQAKGYPGSYSRMTEHVKRWRAEAGVVSARSAYVPLHFEWGEAYQFDWSEEGIVIGGIYRRIRLAHMKLCASRAFWLAAYPGEGHEMLFDAHTRCLAGLGGVARRGIYDNMKTAVDQVGRGKERLVNGRFAAMCAHYLIDADFCNVAAGWEKGRVEKNVQDSRRNLWQAALGERFASFAELNAWLGEHCRAAWQCSAHPEYSGMSIAEAHEHELAYLMPMPSRFDGYLEIVARVSSTCLVTVKRNRYSVPCELAGHRVGVRLYPERIAICSGTQIVAEHPRCLDRDQTVYDWQHYLPLLERKPGALRNGAPFAEMPEALLTLRRALMRHAGGDRVMAQVLCAVPRFGLEAVLVAVELVIASGAISAEHVLNVLARLREEPAVDRVQTRLRLTEEPIADPQRYDRLHQAEATHVEA
jgi:transposase